MARVRDPAQRGTARIEWLATLSLAAAGLAMLHGRTLLSGFGRLPGDLGDTRFNLLLLEHGFRHLRGDAFHRDLWSPPFAFFPHAHVLAYGDNLLGNLPFYVPSRLLGLSPARAFGIWIVLCALLNFAAAVLLGRALGLSPLGAGAAATLFAFGMPRSAQLNHAQLLPHFWTPLCLFALVAAWRSWRAGRVWAARLWAIGGVAGAVAQVAAGIYLGAFLLLGCVALLPPGIVALRQDAMLRQAFTSFVRTTCAAWLAAAAAGIALLYPLAAGYAHAREELGGRGFGEVMGMLPRLASYLHPHPASVLYGWLSPLGADLPVPHEHSLFAGFAPLGALAWIAVSLGRKASLSVPRGVAAAALGVWLFTFLATLRLGSYHGTAVSAWWLFHALPGLDALRAVSRVALLQLLAAGLALGIAVTALQRSARGFRLACAFLLAFAPLAESWCRCPADVSEGEIAARAGAVAERVPAGCAAFFWRGQDASDPDYAVQLDAMWASLELRVPTVNGYGGHDAPGWPFHDPRTATPDQLRDWMAREGQPGRAVCLSP